MAVPSNSKRIIYLAAILMVWAFLWLVPWQPWLDGFPWLGLIAAFMAFITPGACLYQLLYTGLPPRLSAYLTVGFALGVTWVGFTGLIARIVHLPFLFVYYSLFAAGVVGIVLVSLDEERYPHLRWPTLDRSLLRTVLAALPMIMIVAAAAKLSAGPFWGGDKETYTAFITNWQYSDSLNFREVFMGTESVLSIRFWLSLFPMTLALIAKLSGVHGLLLSAIYLRPALVVLAGLGVHELARTLGLSADLAVLAVTAHLFFLFLLIGYSQPGQVFIMRLDEDKIAASYVLAPILLHMIKVYLDEKTRQQLVLLLLVGFSMTFTHPTAMGITCLSGGLFTLLHLLTYRHFKSFLVVGVVLFTIMVAPLSLRFFDSATASNYDKSFSIDAPLEKNFDRTLVRTNILEGNHWYGFKPTLVMITAPFDPDTAPTFPLKIVRNSIFGMLALVGVLAVSRWGQQQAIDRYVITGIGVFLLGIIPYTGRFLGMMITPSQLWRVPWQYPYGIVFAFLVMVIQSLRGTIRPSSEGQSPGSIEQAVPIVAAYLLAAGGLAWLSVAAEELTQPAYQGIEYSSLVAVGTKLDELIPEQAIVLGDQHLDAFLPSLSSHAKVIMMRKMELMVNYGLSLKDATKRDAVFRTIALVDSSFAECLALMHRYGVEYVLVQQDDSIVFQNVLRQTQDHFRLVDNFGGLSLYEFIQVTTPELAVPDPALEALAWLTENTPEGSVIATNVRMTRQLDLVPGRVILAQENPLYLSQRKMPVRSPEIIEDLYEFFEDPRNEVDNLVRIDPDYVVFVRQDDVLGERFAGWETRLPTLRERLMLEERVRFGEEDEIVIYEVVSPPDE
jgi:hypothetical protein